MRLEKIEYSEFENEAKEWKLDDCSFENVNLVVGRNATGKTRTLNIIRGLAALLSENDKLKWRDGKYHIELSSGKDALEYSLEYHLNKVNHEELKINGQTKLTRKDDGSGELYAERETKFIDFKTDTDRIAAIAKRDAFQHSYLDSLYDWANGVTRYDFNTKLGKDFMLLRIHDVDKLDTETRINIKDTEKAVGLFLQGQKEFENEYKMAVLEDMRYLEYDIQEVGVDVLNGITLPTPIPSSSLPSGLFVQESDLSTRTQQHEMSDGMFRALSVLIQVNYALLSQQATCLLIDDIGEGLDFTRSSALVKKLVQKAEGSSIQLIMTTNDRFIMNAVPLDYWIVLIRKGGHVKNMNYSNSKELFDKFEMTGLNNFDFFSSGYYLREG